MLTFFIICAILLITMEILIWVELRRAQRTLRKMKEEEGWF